MAKCENEFVGLHLLHGEMSPLCSSAFEFPSCYLSQEQTNGQYVGAEKKKRILFKVSTASDEDEVIQK